MDSSNIRNFSIIAHIDHGKSTLADRVLEITKATDDRVKTFRVLDNMDLEKERGITIKLNAVRLNYKYNDKDYILNLIDTPGHVDFSYEVSRSLAACEGAILVVDAAQGIEAQTLANVYLAIENDLTIIPIVNKIDLPNANIEKVKEEIKNILGFEEDEIILVSGKTGEGVEDLIKRIIDVIPSPEVRAKEKTKALIFDSYFDSYKGATLLVKVEQGVINKKDTIKLINMKSSFEVVSLGYFTPGEIEVDELKSGEVGFIRAAIKDISEVAVGDTVTVKRNEAEDALPGYKRMQSMVFSGIFPTEINKFEQLKESLERLKLNDSSLTYEIEKSDALGFGFRIGFLGLLHMDIILSRLEREFNLPVIATTPSVIYEVYLTDASIIKIDSPNKMPDKVKIDYIKEPFIYTNIITPNEYIGSIMELCQEKRGIYINTEYLDEARVNIHYELPLSEIVYDFYDKLKSYTKGYASFDYEVKDYKISNLVKMDILLNGNAVDALSVIIHKDFAYEKGKLITEKLKKLIPRHMFQIPIQASIGSKIIARENISALRKNVTAKCYGGDISRKKKLLEKQKEGKKKMKMVGNVEVPNEVFLEVLKNE